MCFIDVLPPLYSFEKPSAIQQRAIVPCIKGNWPAVPARHICSSVLWASLCSCHLQYHVSLPPTLPPPPQAVM